MLKSVFAVVVIAGTLLAFWGLVDSQGDHADAQAKAAAARVLLSTR